MEIHKVVWWLRLRIAAVYWFSKNPLTQSAETLYAAIFANLILKSSFVRSNGF
jgi:hypothetical protein